MHLSSSALLSALRATRFPQFALVGRNFFLRFLVVFAGKVFEKIPGLFLGEMSGEVRCSVFVNVQNTKGPNVFGERSNTGASGVPASSVEELRNSCATHEFLVELAEMEEQSVAATVVRAGGLCEPGVSS